jgi:hypothetical protein
MKATNGMPVIFHLSLWYNIEIKQKTLLPAKGKYFPVCLLKGSGKSSGRLLLIDRCRSFPLRENHLFLYNMHHSFFFTLLWNQKKLYKMSKDVDCNHLFIDKTHQEGSEMIINWAYFRKG